MVYFHSVSAVIFLAVLLLYPFIRTCEATLIASSKINYCGRDNFGIDPKQLSGKRCSKKFVVALTVENGKVNVILFYDSIKSIAFVM